MRVLIAEDEAVSRSVLRALVETSGLEPVIATDGDAAWAILQEPGAPRLLLLDWMMPGLNGIELCRRVRAQEWSVEPYVIMVTARVETDDIVAGLDAGANDYISKPVEPIELRARIEVGRRHLELQAELDDRVRALQDALDQVRTLQGIIPICSYCHKIRDDRQAWHQMESYVTRHTDAQFSHGICPDCVEKHFSELDQPTG